MSTILRALRRLEQEKAEDPLADLHDNVVAPPPAQVSRKWRGAVMVVGAAVTAAGLGGALTWQLLGGTNEIAPIGVPRAEPVAAVAPAPRALTARDERPSDADLENALASLRRNPAFAVAPMGGSAGLAPVAAAPPTARADPPREISSEVVIHQRPRPTPAASAPDPVQPAPPAPPPVAAAVPPARTAPAPEPLRQPVARPAELPAPSRRPAVVPEPLAEPVEVAALVPEPEAQPEPAPPGESSEIPVVTVTRTVWHPKPERRSAIVEVAGNPAPVELKEGDRLGVLVLTQIKPSGVVFDYEGVELVRKIGAR